MFSRSSAPLSVSSFSASWSRPGPICHEHRGVIYMRASLKCSSLSAVLSSPWIFGSHSAVPIHSPITRIPSNVCSQSQDSTDHASEPRCKKSYPGRSSCPISSHFTCLSKCECTVLDFDRLVVRTSIKHTMGWDSWDREEWHFLSNLTKADTMPRATTHCSRYLTLCILSHNFIKKNYLIYFQFKLAMISLTIF